MNIDVTIDRGIVTVVCPRCGQDITGQFDLGAVFGWCGCACACFVGDDRMDREDLDSIVRSRLDHLQWGTLRIEIVDVQAGDETVPIAVGWIEDSKYPDEDEED